MTAELPPRRTIYDVIDQIKANAQRAPREGVQLFANAMHTRDAAGIRNTVQILSESIDNYRERLQGPLETLRKGGDIEDRAVLAISLANALELPYEIRVQEQSLFLYVDGIEVLHK
jgi:hypothetical protein